MKAALGAVGAAAALLLLPGCSPKRPVLYPNHLLQDVGMEVADVDIDDCIELAETHGQGTNRAGNVAKGTASGGAAGAVTGAAVGAVLGPLGRGAAAGAAGGAASGFMRALFRSRDPDPIERNFVERCLHERGFVTTGWR